MSEEGESHLSADEERIVDRLNNISIRKHGVALERVQRCHLGIDCEPMEFNEATIADMIQDIADGRVEHDAFALHAVARALRGLDDHHVLILKQKKPGKWESPTEHEAKANRELSWLYTLGAWERDGMKTEAAVARLAELAGVSRATVFAGVRNAEKFLERCREWGSDAEHLQNPRPAKAQNS